MNIKRKRLSDVRHNLLYYWVFHCSLRTPLFVLKCQAITSLTAQQTCANSDFSPKCLCISTVTGYVLSEAHIDSPIEIQYVRMTMSPILNKDCGIFEEPLNEQSFDNHVMVYFCVTFPPTSKDTCGPTMGSSILSLSTPTYSTWSRPGSITSSYFTLMETSYSNILSFLILRNGLKKNFLWKLHGYNLNYVVCIIFTSYLPNTRRSS